MSLPAYAELHCRSNFSFLTGASHPEELVQRAHELGYSALAITDECSVAGVVRAHTEADRLNVHLIIGTQMQLTLADSAAPHARIVLLAQTRRGYGNLSHWITVARRRAAKGSYLAHPTDVEGKVPNAPTLTGLPDCLALLVPNASQPFEEVFAHAMWLKTWFQDRAAIAIELLHRAGDDDLLDVVRRVANFTGLPIVAAGDVLMHLRSRKPLQDTLSATRLAEPAAQCAVHLESNAEQPRRSRARLASLYEPEWLENRLVLAGRCGFSLSELKYEYPEEIVPQGETPASHLRNLTYAGVPKRFPNGLSDELRGQIEHDLALIRRVNYEPYFLTVADIVRWARAQGILCQGRGSAANSVVCYCLEVTEVDPRRAALLFERFISAERNEPPDIDIDFEHQRREEVIQYIYAKYGRHRAALTAVVICYRPRSALRDVGRALRMDLQRTELLSKSMYWFDGRNIDELRLIKVDILALGMLSALRRALEFIGAKLGRELRMQDIPRDDATTFEMICAADTVGTFQIESRAQMSMLPRLQPRCYYDLVIEVAIVRPGPIQGGMVHPYLKNREKLRRGGKVHYRYPALIERLGRTLGVPIFQEQ